MRNQRLFLFVLISAVVAGTAAFLWLPRDTQATVDPTEIEESMDACRNGNDTIQTLHCWRDLAESLLAAASYPELINAFDDVERDCHDLMHYVARGAYRDYHDLAKLYSESSYVCFGAAYHGGAEGFLETEKLAGASPEEIRHAMKKVCADEIGTVSSNIRNQCLHGLGHALMVITDGDLPTSLEECASLGEAGGKDLICAGGVFMENQPTSQTNPHVVRYLRDDDPLFPCNSISKRFEETCYAFQVTQFGRLADYRVDGMVKLCESTPSYIHLSCIKSLGPMIFGTSGQQAEESAATCEEMPTTPYRHACQSGVIVAYLDRFAGNEAKLVGMFSFCDILASQDKPVCYNAAGDTLRALYTDDKERHIKLCKTHTPMPYREYCLSPEPTES